MIGTDEKLDSRQTSMLITAVERMQAADDATKTDDYEGPELLPQFQRTILDRLAEMLDRSMDVTITVR